MRQVRLIVEPRGCGPLGGSVIIVTEYTGVTCNGNVDAKSQSDQLLLFSIYCNSLQHPAQLYLGKSHPHFCHGDSHVAPHYPGCTVPSWIQSLYNSCMQALVHSPLQSKNHQQKLPLKTHDYISVLCEFICAVIMQNILLS